MNEWMNVYYSLRMFFTYIIQWNENLQSLYLTLIKNLSTAINVTFSGLCKVIEKNYI